jgi:MraZ protein
MSLPGRILYTGSFRHNLDDKGRLTIPSAWRTAHTENDEFLATPNPDGYVSVLPPTEVAKLYDKVAQVPMADAEAQAELAAFFALAQAFTFDKQGRIGLSDALLKHAGIAKEAVLGGSLTKFNIYSPERWTLVEQRPGASNPAGFLRRYQI